MKTSNTEIEKDPSENQDITVIIKTGSKNPTPVLISILPILSMLLVVLPRVLLRADNVTTIKLGIITILLTGAAVFYIRIYAENILQKRLAKTVILLGYLSSISLLLFVPGPETFSFWMLGGLLIAMLIDNKLGLLIHFNLSFLMGIAFPADPEDLIRILIVGTLMCVLAGSMKQRATVIYSAIIILSTNITIAFTINNFIFEKENNFNYFSSLFSIFAVLTAAYLINLLYGYFNKQSYETVEKAEPLTKNREETIDNHKLITEPLITEAAADALNTIPEAMELSIQELGAMPDISDMQLTMPARTSYEILCDPDNELLRKLKEFSKSLYEHALEIADLSSRAAKEIGADEMLTKAGGLYHEIGKINGKNYIEEGLLIAEDYSFPKELKAILKEHNIKYEKPGSAEAAIVMLSDSVVSTIEYIEKNNDHRFTSNKVIDNIFQMRMDKGSFDAASLSLRDYKKLKDFYQREFAQRG